MSRASSVNHRRLELGWHDMDSGRTRWAEAGRPMNLRAACRGRIVVVVVYNWLRREFGLGRRRRVLAADLRRGRAGGDNGKGGEEHSRRTRVVDWWPWWAYLIRYIGPASVVSLELVHGP